jgi:hypothetical protein
MFCMQKRCPRTDEHMGSRYTNSHSTSAVTINLIVAARYQHAPPLGRGLARLPQSRISLRQSRAFLALVVVVVRPARCLTVCSPLYSPLDVLFMLPYVCLTALVALWGLGDTDPYSDLNGLLHCHPPPDPHPLSITLSSLYMFISHLSLLPHMLLRSPSPCTRLYRLLSEGITVYIICMCSYGIVSVVLYV